MKLFVIVALILVSCGGSQDVKEPANPADPKSTITPDCPCGKADLDSPPPAAPTDSKTP